MEYTREGIVAMKKIIILLLLTLTIFQFSSCNSNKNSSKLELNFNQDISTISSYTIQGNSKDDLSEVQNTFIKKL